MTPEELKRYLEYQADRIEAVLGAHKAPARVTGGSVGPQLICMNLTPSPHVRAAAIRALADDLSIAVKAAVIVDATPEGIIITYNRPDPQPVTLKSILNITKLPQSATALGIASDGLPFLLKLSSSNVAHVLIAGTTGSGKSALLRTMAGAMVLTQAPRNLSLICIDPKRRTLSLEFNPPHLANPLIDNADDAVCIIQRVLHLMEQRDRQRTTTPRLVVIIDELSDLVMTGGDEIRDGLIRLVQRGREAGIHLLAATQRPSSAQLSALMKANFPVRIVGRVTDPSEAYNATGAKGTGAENLAGRGDFILVGGGETSPIRFQAAYISQEDLDSMIISKWGAQSANRQTPLALPPAAVVPPPETPQEQRIREDAEKLLACENREGRTWLSLTEAASWLSDGASDGGKWFYRARDAATWLIKNRHHYNRNTTTTTATPSNNPGSGFPRPLGSSSSA